MAILLIRRRWYRTSRVDLEPLADTPQGGGCQAARGGSRGQRRKTRSRKNAQWLIPDLNNLLIAEKKIPHYFEVKCRPIKESARPRSGKTRVKNNEDKKQSRGRKCCLRCLDRLVLLRCLGHCRVALSVRQWCTPIKEEPHAKSLCLYCCCACVPSLNPWN